MVHFLDKTPPDPVIDTDEHVRWLIRNFELLENVDANVPTLLNSWTSLDSSFPVQFYKNVLGIVRFENAITGGTTTGGTDLFVLSVGFRPVQDLFFNLVTTGGTVIVKVATTGVVDLATASSTTIWLDGITFRAA